MKQRSEGSESVSGSAPTQPPSESGEAKEDLVCVEIPVQEGTRKLALYVDLDRSRNEIEELLQQIDEYENEVLVYRKNSETMMNELSRLRGLQGLREGSALEEDQERITQMEAEMAQLREASTTKEAEVQELKRKVQRLEALKNELNEHLNAKEKELKALYKQNRNSSHSNSSPVCSSNKHR